MSSSKTAALPAGMKLSINPVIPHLADELWHYECVVSPRSPINTPSSPSSSSSSSSSSAAPSRSVTTLQHSRSGNNYFSESPTKAAPPPTRFGGNSPKGRGAAAEVSGPPHQSSIAASSSSSYSPSTSTRSDNRHIHYLADHHVSYNHGERSDDEAMVQLLRRIFRTFDENSDGSISKEELSRMFERLGISSASQEEAMKGLLDSEVFKERVEVDEAHFVALMLGRKGELEGPEYPSSSTQGYGTAGQEEDQDQQQERQEDTANEESSDHGTNMCDNMVGHDLKAAAHTDAEDGHEDLALMQAAFRVFDKDQNGFISPSELQSVLCGLGFSQAQDLDACVRMIQRVDQNGDGQIDFFEFTSMITSSTQPLPFVLSF